MNDVPQQCRSWHARALSGPARVRASVALLGTVLVLAGCTTAAGDPEQTTGPEVARTAESTTPEPALAAACEEFWDDPDYTAPLSRVILDRAATAPDAGPSDPFFYAMTGDDIEAVFDSAPEGAQQAATELADWFRSEPEQGAEADRDGFRAAWEGMAGACADASVAAAWAQQSGEDGTKPAALTCADVFDTPGTLTHFGNANVLTSNMFKLVGLSARTVPSDRSADVQATADLLAGEIAATDDDDVRAALEQVRAPFQDALDGDAASEGLREPLTQLGTACDAVGYSSPDPGEIESGDAAEEGGLV
ncbi:hypothetical protein [Brachybacterium sp. FME24]|uniref:hypothetical protein n=1 Tax=Brachybacterium sp. FME24 TaxID=2742605 RepID=UPI001D01A5C2|nr:hypothetical protein [Brachybacterium sp. FME24]